MNEASMPSTHSRLVELLAGMWQTRVLCVAARLRVADALSDGPRMPSELAHVTETDEHSLRRLLRASARLGVFSEDTEGRFANTELSRLLRPDVPGSVYARAMGAADWGWRAWAELEHSVRTGEPAFDKVYDMPLFAYFADVDTEAGELFDRSMADLSASTELPVCHAADWRGVRSVVDVGGGYGGLVRALLRHVPSVERGVVFDQPHVVEAAEDIADDDRIQMIGGDFFESAPSGHDVYLTKWMLHDWDDEQAAQILTNCAKAMNPGGRVLCAEAVLNPESGDPLPYLFDLHMMVHASGHERTEDEFRELFESSGLRLTRIIPTGSFLSLVEGVRA
ncbi:methyltransferase [Pseudonocardia spinosispora]|uniref:methyltransferase n=1 Tax=Pseudonocardia spinosispora TaxID=103441 RepID=UPI0004918DD5|nr:methyltransferase [Pseudonocardia spinosispora]